MSGIAGLRGTGDWGTDERPQDFRESILFYNPNGTAPIFALSSKAGKKKTTDPQFHWWNESQVNVRLQVNGALASGDSLITVDSADPTTTTPGANRGTATHLKPGDVLLVEPSSDNATFDHELLQVDTVISDTQFTATRGAGGTTAASISDDAWLLLISSAYAEGTGAPTAVARNPLKYTNYTQIFKNTYELTGTADNTRARTGPAWSNDKKRKMFDHSRDIEWSILFGRSAELTGSNGKPLRFMGGIRSFIPSNNVNIFSSAVTVSSFLDEVSPVFDFDTQAGDTRMAFAGNTAITELTKVFQSNSNVTINYDKEIKMFGMDVTEFVLPRGRLLMKSHPLLSQQGGIWSSGMFILDFSAIKYVYLQNRDTKVMDDVQTKDEDVRRGFIQTECSLSVDFGGLTCAYLGNISAT